MKKNAARIVSTGGIFTAMAVMLHASPVFFPGIGLFLSPLSTLPVVLSTMHSSVSGALTLYCGSLLLLFISPQEAVIYLFTTGLLGFSLGTGIKRNMVQPWIISSLALCTGLVLLTSLVGIAAFGSLTGRVHGWVFLLALFIFSIIYSGIWLMILRLLFKRLMGVGFIRSFLNLYE